MLSYALYRAGYPQQFREFVTQRPFKIATFEPIRELVPQFQIEWGDDEIVAEWALSGTQALLESRPVDIGFLLFMWINSTDLWRSLSPDLKDQVITRSTDLFLNTNLPRRVRFSAFKGLVLWRPISALKALADAKSGQAVPPRLEDSISIQFLELDEDRPDGNQLNLNVMYPEITIPAIKASAAAWKQWSASVDWQRL